ncbi:MAG TPA: aldo/keto reductase [Flavobacterium sp.]|jgi:predicted oxidoreductase
MLSKIIAGTMNWGAWDKKLTTSEMASLIVVCLENKITTFDHADIYGSYTTEAEFGAAFSQSKINRDSIQIITKCGIRHISENRNHRIKHYDYSKDYIIWCAENSLQNLGTDYLDVLLLHRPSPLMHPDEIAEAVMQLKRQGKIRDFGVSNFTPSQTDLIRQRVQVDYNQIQFSATHFTAMLDGTLDHMQMNNIRPMAWNPLGCVFRADTQQVQRLKKLLAELTTKYECGDDTILLSWTLRHPANIIPVAGTANVARIQQLMKATELELELEDWFAIWIASMGEKVP